MIPILNGHSLWQQLHPGLEYLDPLLELVDEVVQLHRAQLLELEVRRKLALGIVTPPRTRFGEIYFHYNFHPSKLLALSALLGCTDTLCMIPCLIVRFVS